jgi:hypothetical protein
MRNGFRTLGLHCGKANKVFPPQQLGTIEVQPFEVPAARTDSRQY